MLWRRVILATAVSGVLALPAFAQTSGGRGTVSGTAAGYGGSGNTGNPAHEAVPPAVGAQPDPDVNSKGNEPRVPASNPNQKSSKQGQKNQGAQSSTIKRDPQASDQSNEYIGAGPEQSQGSGGSGARHAVSTGQGTQTDTNLGGQGAKAPANTQTPAEKTGSSAASDRAQGTGVEQSKSGR